MRKYRLKLSHFNILLFFCTIFIISITFLSTTLAWNFHEEATTGGENANYTIRIIKYEENTENPIVGSDFTLHKEDDTQIGLTYTTNQEGKIEISGIDVKELQEGGNFYFKEIKAPYGYLLDTTNNHNMYPFTLDEKHKDVDLTIYNKKIKKTLFISKIVENHSLEDDTDFTFTITLGNDTNKEYPYQINDIPMGMIKSGQQIRLKANEIAAIEDIDIGTIYNITEEQVNGYTSLYTKNTSGTMIEEGVTAVFINSKEIADEKNSLIISKVVTGHKIDRNKEFGFHVKIGETSHHFTLKHGQTYEIDQIEIGSQYTVEEDENTTQGYVIDSVGSVGNIKKGKNVVLFVNEKKEVEDKDIGTLTIHHFILGEEIDIEKKFEFKVTIGDREETIFLRHQESHTFKDLKLNERYIVNQVDYFHEGYITTSIGAVGTIQKNTIATFMNQKDKESTVNTLTITKVVHGEIEDKSFKFKVTIDETVHEIKLKHQESYTFKNLKAGSHYSIIEDDYTTQGYTSMIHDASGIVVEGNKQVVVTNYNQNKAMITISGKKQWDHGNNVKEAYPKSIEVILKADEQVVTKKSVNDTDDWQYQFVVPKYKDDGVTLIEYAIDETSIPGYEKEVINQYDLINRYMATTPVLIEVNKEMIGDVPPTSSVFFFEMERITSNAPMPKGSNEDKVRIAIQGVGLESFDAMLYTDVGIYEYRIYEIKEDMKGYVYDPSEYIVKVTISQEGETIKAEKEIIKNEIAVDTIIFMNQYESMELKEYANLVISKEVKAEKIDINQSFDFKAIINNEEFSFTLKHGETHIIENVLVGSTYQVEEKNYVSEGYTTTTIDATGTIKKGNNKVVFINTKDDIPKTKKDTGTLTITKYVQQELNPNKEFKFDVRIGTIKYVVSLKHNESKTFYDIPFGTSYSVEEHNYYKEGYETSSKNSCGVITGEHFVEFTNRKRGNLSYTGKDSNIKSILIMTILFAFTTLVIMIKKRKLIFNK